MKALRFAVRVTMACAMVAVMATATYAADSFKLSETYNSKLKCETERYYGYTYFYCEELWSGKFTINAKLFTDTGVNPASFNSETPVEILVGDFYFAGVLGDFEYVPGGNSATFKFTGEKCSGYYYDNCKTVTLGTISLKFSAKGMTVKISGKTDDENFYPLFALNWTDKDTGTYTDSTSASISVGGLTYSQEISINGTVKRKVTTKDEEEYSLFNIKLQGVPGTNP